MSKDKLEFDFDNWMEVEDSLQESHVFLNGIRGTPCHSDSYMTVVSFDALWEWYKTQTFSKELLQSCVNYWSTNPNMQPPLRMVAKFLERKLS